MADMLDVTHYLLEEDSLRGIAMAESPADTVADMRRDLYRSLYGRDHGPREDDTVEYEETASGPRRRMVKPYIPPTEVTENEAAPYGNVVGAPLGF